MQKLVKITSKGRITVPQEIRRIPGVRPGDRLMFESAEEGMRVRPVRTKSPFAKYKGIGNSGIHPGRTGIHQWIRELRGE